MDLLWNALLTLAGLLGLALVPFGLPGNWVLAAAAAGGAWLHGNLLLLGVSLAAAVLAEVLEFGLGIRHARRHGAGKAGMWGAVLGSIAGAILGTPLLPVLGTLLGAMAGALAGAFLLEVALARRASGAALRAGWGAALGTFLGRAAKVGLACFQLAWLVAALWLGGSPGGGGTP